MGGTSLPGADRWVGTDRQLVLGPAGVGKSHRLRESFVEALRAGGAAETLLLVPTSSYRDHTRNLVLREGGLRGFSDAAICTFPDLLERLFSESHRDGPGDSLLARRSASESPAELSAARRELLIRRLLRELALPYLNAVRDFAGFRTALGDALEEARRAGVEPDTLPDALDAALRDAAPSARHHAFRQLFRTYIAGLAQGGADATQRVSPALESLAEGDLPLRLLLLDGFADFTAEQRVLLTALLAHAPVAVVTVVVTLTLDPQKRDFFHQAERSRAWLQSLGFREVWMEGNHRARGESLAAVERGLREGRAEAPPPLWTQEAALSLWSAADRRDEAELIGREILRLGRSGFRYGEIGVIARSPREYVPLLRGVFRRLGIPLRAFVPVSPADTAAGRHLCLCLDLFQPGSRPQSVFRWLKSPYGLLSSRKLVEKFEYRAIEHLAEGREGRWDGCVTQGTRLADILKRLAAFEAELAGLDDPSELAAWTLRLWREFTRLGEISDQLRPERALELRTEAVAFRRIESLLGEIAEAAQAEHAGPMSFPEFRELLLSLLAREPFWVRDRRRDAVNLMNPFEARQWELRAVFVVGLVENEFPAPIRDPLFLDDDDREALEKTSGLVLPTTAHRLLEERLLFYAAATRARDRLYLTYPLSDSNGTPLLRSSLLRGLGPLLESPACGKLQRERSATAFPTELATGTGDLLALAHTELGARSPQPEELSRAVALYEELRPSGATRRAAAALVPRPGRLLLEAARTRLRERAVLFSASGFRTFAECAFKYFAQESLKLQGPPLPKEIDPQLAGKIAHATIEAWERGGRSQPIGELLESCFDKKTSDIPPGHLAAKEREELRRWLERFAAFEQQHGDRYRTEIRPEYIELTFGYADGAPALEVTLADHTIIRVLGRLDRVEVVSAGDRKLGLVVDFKYNAELFKKENWNQLQQGLELQFPIYLLALQERFGLVPAGAELYPLKTETLSRRGIYDSALLDQIFQQPPPAKAIRLDPPQFREMMEQGRQWMAQHAENIRDGEIAVFPKFPERCKNCAFFDLCRVKQWEFPGQRARAWTR